ncbi:hypothetical protein OKW21_000723 [Catalinimonas alkaloidigena]|uniref:hypothetical protein n=1 Tax=Catalinimonas alkaloidigena TaxID=1075417 RepID=UPI002404D5A2|nr:hypothetical protein [Catalinimonas alkaloidigena]MDF9795460.1 hypothetical protein [Catalinimonas alkaloidigena]
MFQHLSVLLLIVFSTFNFGQNDASTVYHKHDVATKQFVETKIEESEKQILKNKKAPSIIREEIAEVLSYFPELANTQIDFVFKDRINKSFMQAQPKWYGFFQSKSKRDYVIKISRNFQMEGHTIPIEKLPKDIIIGWLAHELGHIMDYQDKSAFALMKFGWSYLTSREYMIEAERTADVQAIHCNLGEYLVIKKNFIQNHTDIPLEYKERIKQFYMSAEEAIELMDNLPDDLLTAD